MDVSNRRVKMFRCHIDPMVGPKPKLAFVPEDMRAIAEIANDSQGPMGIYIKLADGLEHIIPFSNIQSIRLEPMAIPEVASLEERRKPGRPVGT